jgi:tetratricopeptide (TPR) repeat protein
MALHHVAEFRLTRGEAAKLVPIAERMRPLDPAAAAALDCKIAVGERRYADAAAVARKNVTPIAENFICLAQAQALAGDLDAGMATAKQAMDLTPIDLREFGGFSLYAEFFLYRGRVKEYLDLLRGKPSRQRSLTVMSWMLDTNVGDTSPIGTGMRMPPIGAATWIILNHIKGIDVIDVYRDYPEAEVKHYGYGLWAETRGDTAKAIEHYEAGLAVPSKGDMRMLFGHHLARVLYKQGDPIRAKAACMEVIAPRLYQGYRALLLPDCLVWSGMEKQLLDAWTGEFEHPAVIEARKKR